MHRAEFVLVPTAYVLQHDTKPVDIQQGIYIVYVRDSHSERARAVE
jgi:hypothetical protein